VQNLTQVVATLVPNINEQRTRQSTGPISTVFDMSQLTDFSYDPKASLNKTMDALLDALEQPLREVIDRNQFRPEIKIRQGDPIAELTLIPSARRP
jgi:hypothetical protein